MKFAPVKYLFVALSATFFFLTFSSAALSAEKTDKLKITAEHMQYNSIKERVYFKKNVVVVHPDYTLYADELELVLSSKSSGTNNLGINSGKVKIIIAQKNVKIQLAENRLATCNKATYTVSSELLLLEDNPILKDDSNTIKGKQIIFNLKDSSSEVLGGVQIDLSTLPSAR